MGFVTGSMGPIAGTRAFLYDSGAQKTTTIGPLPGHAMAFGHAINDSRHVAGVSQDAEWKNAHAFMYADGQLVDRGVASWVTGINATDMIVGSKAFRGATTWTAYRQPLGGAFENLGTTSKPGFNGSHGNAINDSGVVVGHAFATGSTVFRAFVQFPAGSDEPGWFDLQDVTNNLGAWVLESAVGINGSGQIVGNGHIGNDDQGRGFLLTPKKSQLFAPKDLSKYAIAFIALIGGVEAGAGGIGILPGGKPVPIDPHGWRALSPAERDLRIGLAVSRVAALLDDRGSARTIERAAKEIVRRSVAKLEQEVR
jgi:probable HAF family extracellular repeat protein